MDLQLIQNLLIGEILSSKVKKNKKGNSVYTALFGQGTFNEQQTLCAEMKDILATVSHGGGRARILTVG